MKQELNLRLLHAVKKIRSGVSLGDVAVELGTNIQGLDDVASMFEGTSDPMLKALERVLEKYHRLSNAIAKMGNDSLAQRAYRDMSAR